MRFSIGKMMFLVAACGLNFFLLGKLGTDPRTWGVEKYFGELILLGGLPMADLLAVLVLIRKPGRRAVDDILVGGGLALAIYLAIASVAAESIRGGILCLLDVITPLDGPGLVALIGRLICAVLVNLLPQVAVADLLGRLIRMGSGRTADPPNYDGTPPA